MKYRWAFCVAAIAATVTPTHAQDKSTGALHAAVNEVAPPMQPTILRAGTPIPLKFMEELTTKGKSLRVGHRFRLQVSENIRVGDQVVIPVGTPATGEVTDVRNKGMWGKSGKINARAVSLTLNGRSVRLSGQIDDKGVTGTGAVVGSVLLLPIAGFFTTGTSAKIAVDAPLPAFLDEDLKF